MKNPSDWWNDAACKGKDGNIWFPERPQGRDYFAVARKHCESCPVRQPCLEEALSRPADDDRFGMWGGHTPKERARLREGKPAKREEPSTPPVRPIVAPKQRPPQRHPATIHQKAVVAAFMETNPRNWAEIALKRKATELLSTNIPKQTRLLMEVTPMMEPSMVTAQALAAMIAAGWEDPMESRTAAALFMGASYVGELARRGTEAGVLTPQENAAVQGVVDIAMQVWKYHAQHGKVVRDLTLENDGQDS